MAIMLDPVSIEPMRYADLETVLAIDRRCFPTPWHTTAFQTELTNRAACYLVARCGESVVGFAGLWVIAGEAHVTTLAVDPAFQGKKIGEKLLICLLEEAVLRGARRGTLEVREGNRTAQRLYKKYHFREAALRRSYYTDNGENAVVMWADDMDRAAFSEHLRAMRHRLRDDGRSRLQ
jgi:ribosomal-protein-alanine N-acetyltransferase